MRLKRHTQAAGTLAAVMLLGAATAAAQDGEAEAKLPPENPYPSTYEPLPSEPMVIENAVILDGRGGRIEGGEIYFEDGEIVAVGENVDAPSDATVIDANGKWVTPGIIDVHSHLGVYPSPGVQAHADGNEITSPNTAEVWAEHSVWPHDPGFVRAMAGGITALQILPGSANLFGGRAVTLKPIPARTVQDMKFPDAPYGLKMACGENPKRVYGSKGRAPSTRMGNFAGYRQAWIKAAEYKRKWDKYEDKLAENGETDNGDDENDENGGPPKPPSRNLQLETLKGVLEGDILLHMHCYRGDEMAQVIDMSEEFGYHLGTFHHAVEAYKVADKLAENDTCAAMWADWWGFKLEAYDGIRENIPFVHAAGGCAIVHSDSAVGIQRLNQEAAKALSDARRAGLDISKAEAWTWLSHNPAKSIGIAEETGALEPGKNADIVLWNGDPFSSYTKAEKVFVDGARVWDLNDSDRQPITDFQLGQPGEEDAT